MSEMCTLVATDDVVLLCQLEPIQKRIGWRVTATWTEDVLGGFGDLVANTAAHRMEEARAVGAELAAPRWSPRGRSSTGAPMSMLMSLLPRKFETRCRSS